jgi:hypothetical protein
MINLAALHETLVINDGKTAESLKYHCRLRTLEDGSKVVSEHRRYFCNSCGSHLYAWHPKWPKLSHPVATSVDTPLPVAQTRYHIFTSDAPAWIKQYIPETDQHNKVFQEYPDRSISAHHKDESIVAQHRAWVEHHRAEVAEEQTASQN